MGISSSALPALAVLAVRASGPILSTVTFLRGRYAYALFLFLLVHFVILMPLDIPLLADTEATFAYAVTYPLIALAFAVLGLLNFYLLRLGELLPLTRYLGGYCGTNLGPRPSGAFILVNLVGWLIVSVVSQLLFEWYVVADGVLAIVLLLGCIIVGYAGLLVIHLFFLGTDAPAWGDGSSILRTLLVTGVYHLVSALVTGLIAVFNPDNNWAWVSALIVLGVELIVTIIVYFVAARGWTMPPRTGVSATFARIGSNNRDAMPITGVDVVDASDEALTDSENGVKARPVGNYTAPNVYNRQTNATAPLFGAKHA